MSYNDFWFIETRDQKVNLRRWFLWAVMLFAFVTIGVYICIKSMYMPISNFQVKSAEISAVVEEARATNVNGYVKGYIENITEQEVNEKYMKFDFYDNHNELKGTEYIEIGNMQPGEKKTYEMQFRYDHIKNFILSITDSKEI